MPAKVHLDCLYCPEKFKDFTELERHIDRDHKPEELVEHIKADYLDDWRTTRTRAEHSK